MTRRMTFVTVQRLAAEAGLVMSRDYGSLDIRLRYRDRPRGPRWIVSTLDEALELIARRSARRGAGAA